MEVCRQRVEIGLLGVLKVFVCAEALPSQSCLQLSKKIKDNSVSLRNRLVNSVHKVDKSDRLAPLSMSIIDISSAIFTFPTPFLYNTIFNKVYSVNAALSAMNFCCAISFCL
ncbi:hypothetical protein AVEN_262351-1 [Araneus ventricosus]|uniref:Uncharacterized protein n=1 Tax=Araneus ventricosus TaxID=182803 RepID=A0A4Y2PXY2_ARAVE|nr:hypothetical protein AVEN_262351-1 [Araneus ventricosus]